MKAGLHPLVKELALIREVSGLSIRAAAELAGISYSTVTAWENGTQEPTLVPLLMYGAIYGLNLSWEGLPNVTNPGRPRQLSALPKDPLPPITPEMAAQNLRALQDALDDSPVNLDGQPDPSPYKECTKCGEVRDLTQFWRDRTRADGRYPQCVPCRNSENRARSIDRGRQKGAAA